MKTNTGFSKIKIQSSKLDRTKLNFNHPFFSTTQIGEVQPSLVQLMLPNSSASVKCQELIRMDPLVSPTYGPIKGKIWHNFVAMSDLIRSYTKFRANQTYNQYTSVGKQISLPSMRLCDLSMMCLIGAHISIYENTDNPGVNPETGTSTKWLLHSCNDARSNSIVTKMVSIGMLTASDANGVWAGIWPQSASSFASSFLFRIPGATQSDNFIVPLGNELMDSSGNYKLYDAFKVEGTLLAPLYKYPASVPVQLGKADVRVYRPITIGNDTITLCIACRFSSFGRRLFKHMNAAGYKFNLRNTKQVNLLPLFAIYKSYWDVFGLTLYQNWESTNAQHLLNDYDNAKDTISNIFSFKNSYFARFITDLGNTFVTDEQDFVSSHTIQDAVTGYDVGFVSNVVLAPSSSVAQTTSGQTDSTTVVTGTNHVFINSVNHSQVSAELLKRLYKVTNRNTIAGRRIRELLKAGGYGAYVDEQKSSFIGTQEIEVNVSDVNATADSSNSVTGNNSVLGEYAGKGIGFDNNFAKKTFKYETDELGYWVSLNAITVDASYCQGMDQTLYDIDRFAVYDPEFDSVGMELSCKDIVCGTSDEFSSAYSDSEFTAPFGYTPRSSKYKVARPLLNGGYMLASERDQYLHYSVEKYLNVGAAESIFGSTDSLNNDTYYLDRSSGITMSDIPLAGNAHRYNARYPWLNNYQRIFSVILDLQSGTQLTYFVNTPNVYELTHWLPDSFNLLGYIYMDYHAPVKPIDESFGTIDEDNPKPDMSMGKA